jgi:GntR family transcriptional regulator, transcriptional repressor for pyruvate dehydrogenase complex
MAKTKPIVSKRGQSPLTSEGQPERSSIANIVSRKLFEGISQGEFPVGSSLPSERELMNRYGVSRATVREALRVLRAQDLIQVRRGRNGGSFISSPSSQSVVRSLNQFINGQDFRFVDLVSARLAIEPAAAAQAAICRSVEKLDALRVCSEECESSLEDIDRFVDANLEWHLALAEASENPLFVAFLTSIASAIHSATAFEEFDIRTRMAVVKVHWQIYEAIYERDSDAARRRTMGHLGAYSDKLESLLKEAIVDESLEKPVQ